MEAIQMATRVFKLRVGEIVSVLAGKSVTEESLKDIYLSSLRSLERHGSLYAPLAFAFSAVQVGAGRSSEGPIALRSTFQFKPQVQAVCRCESFRYESNLGNLNGPFGLFLSIITVYIIESKAEPS
ncbi:hypothetical protein [Pseudomonas svalbardensis]|uniref:hypothetical protein n=1 Tax=Pseudomonas svalbardensis TaxID=3042029 RepID=UPI0024B3870C|nr:hypothetical protein [Pseudomonas sp. PMCC200367]